MNISDKDITRDLALQLKSACDKNGQEINLSKSAEIIYKLGLVYFEKRPDKISLIKSVGLLNSAIARKPNNAFEIESKLVEVCQYILQQADARDKTADLIEISRQVKTMINNLRSETNHLLEELKCKCESKSNNWMRRLKTKVNFSQQHKNIKIKSIQKIQNRITAQYKDIMKNISKYCIKILGPPPCKFAVAGMGSLARKEITPYSDFEHIILLEIQTNHKKHLEYFRWFSVIFHVIILNLQETIIPSLNIKHLNDQTNVLGDWFFDSCTSGVSFDGMMPHACKFPLGRTDHTKEKTWTTELIKPVDKMLEYLSSEVNLKNDYHLSDMLMESCFVYGNQKIYDEFEYGIHLYKKSKTQTERCEEIRKQVNEDLDKTAIRKNLVNLNPGDKLNVKLIFYRSATLFLAALGKIYNAKSSSCFRIINELAEQRIISQNTKHKLSVSAAIACEIRLRVYMKEKSQRNYIQPCENATSIFDKIVSIVGRESVISYFQITYYLQREIIKILRIKETHIYSNARLLNITICYALRLDALMLTLIEKHKLLSSSASLDGDTDAREKYFKSKNVCNYFDQDLAQVENELASCASTTSSQPELISLYDSLWDIASDLNQINIDETLELLKRVVEILQRSPLSDEDRNKISENEDTDFDSFIGWTNILIAVCLVALSNFDEALRYMNQANNYFDIQNNSPEVTAKFYFLAGNNWIELKEYDKSLNCLQTALGISLSIDVNEYIYSYIDKYEITMMYTGIGICLLKLYQYEESRIYLKIAVEMLESNFVDESHDFYYYLAFRPAITYQNLGKCLIKLQKFKKGLPCLYQAVELTTNGNSDEENDKILTQLAKQSSSERRRSKHLASIFYDLGLWYMKHNCFEEAVSYLQRSFNLYNNLSEAEDIAAIRVEILTCCMEIYQHDRVKKYFKSLSKSKTFFTSISKIDLQNLTYVIKI